MFMVCKIYCKRLQGYFRSDENSETVWSANIIKNSEATHFLLSMFSRSARLCRGEGADTLAKAARTVTCVTSQPGSNPPPPRAQYIVQNSNYNCIYGC